MNTSSPTPAASPTTPDSHDRTSSGSKPRWQPVYLVATSILTLALLANLLGDGNSDTPPTTGATETETLLASPVDTARQAAESRRRMAVAKVETLERKLLVLRQTHSATEAELEACVSQIRAYAMNHKMAIAAMGITIGGGAVALDGTNRFTEEEKIIGGIGAGVAALYALFNAEECGEVVDYMAKASARQKDCEARIARAKLQIVGLQSELEDAKAEARML